ncbi:sigma-70 family RNA polymerase sigma factor [Streptomyces candidus]|uniref:DNA-directed RNA polymerase specialized sigma24 family protein n=1 Tax=Streptomyces candidus TaxID=67283 RepID=A0A7X0HLX6_9ACTN|nr:sigma-70 family RNA polymerase sigma factor [Streptomyces candidus]MBB6439976.1 DNA-directed RNA polymerase specialized sigma24 family protein [Streptomyces candidus]GHH58367.1 hypothetical protein GCM10018773_66520 [Streptomyces candidus]
MNTSDTPDTSASRPAPEAAPVRPGRKLGPIADTVGSPHRAWLEPTRSSYLTSGRTLSDLSAHVHLAKSKLSELLRGVGHYPRWEVIHRLSTELHLPTWPLYRLWKGAALDIGKSRDWVQSSTDGTTLATTHSGPPMEHGALRTLLCKDYRRYALAFLPDDACEAAVEDAFAILWLSFTEALTSPDIRRYAWGVLRATVMAKTPHRDGRPELEAAAFDTVFAVSPRTSEDERLARLPLHTELFIAISKLPDAQLDITVLRHLCGFTPERASDLLGVPLATVLSGERHAKRALEDAAILPPATGGPVL